MSPHRLIQHGTTDSTNERALDALVTGEARDGDCHVADRQTAGRGSRGRRWESARGDGLYASLVHLPRTALASTPALTMACGLAVREVCLGLGLEETRLKWPNDVLVAERKIAGILIEARDLGGGRLGFVCGIGLNVAQRAFPGDLRRPATSLALEGVEEDPIGLLSPLLEALDRRLALAHADGTAIASEFAAAAGLSGELRVAVGDAQHLGRLVDFGLDGLRLATAAGEQLFALEHVTAAARA